MLLFNIRYGFLTPPPHPTLLSIQELEGDRMVLKCHSSKGRYSCLTLVTLDKMPWISTSWKNVIITYRNTGCLANVLPEAPCSLKWSISNLALRLGDNLMLDRLMQALEYHFGIISKYDTLYWQLYYISQRLQETITQFATRVCRKVCTIWSTYLRSPLLI